VTIVWIILAVVVLVAIYVAIAYNGLVSLRNRIENAWAQIDVQLKRRYDLIPNLVETVKGYMKHERETLEAVISARNQARSVEQRVADNPGDAAGMRELVAAETALTGSLGRMFALSEAYPDLKASANMQQLQDELSSTENRVAFARQAYNDSVMSYNTYRESFPQNQIAGAFGFREAEPFEIEVEAQREAPRVSF
jgi:LemA protein